MSKDPTKNLPIPLSFEDKVLAHLGAIDGRLTNIELRLEKLEAKQYDTKPIWERALAEIADTNQEMFAMRREMLERFRDLEGRIGVLSDDMMGVRASIRLRRTSERPPATRSKRKSEKDRT